ncbi:MAG: glycosyltransferase [Desulfobacterales bacterium]|nr:glycosyltransferase [Desulfobacterales bacterium]
MRILAISYLFPNSIYPNYGIFVHNRLKALQKYCDIKVINPIPYFPMYHSFYRYKNYNLIPKIENLKGIETIHPRFFFIPRFFKSIDAFSFAANIIPIALNQKFDIIDLHWTYPDIFAGYLLSKLTGKKFIVTVRGHEALYLDEISFRQKIIKSFLKKADFVIALSSKLKELCIKNGVSNKKIDVIPNGVDTKAFYYIDKSLCRRHLNINLKERVIISIGSLTYGKGFDRLINVFPQILKSYSDTRLYIIGSSGPAGDYKKDLIKLVNKNGLANHINFIGEVPNQNLVFWYNAADVFCLSSRSEGSPNVLNEALSCGCPSVATDVGTVSEILKNEFMGIISPNNKEGLFAGILNVFSKNYDRTKIAKYMEQFSWDLCAQKVMKIYENIVSS